MVSLSVRFTLMSRSSGDLQAILGGYINRYFNDDTVDSFSRTAATLIKDHLIKTFQTYLDQIAQGPDPVQALTESPFWQEGGAFREVAQPAMSTSPELTSHSLQEQLDIIAPAYNVSNDEYNRWGTIIFDVERLSKYAESPDGDEAEYDLMDTGTGY